MTPEEKDLIHQLKSPELDLKQKEKAIKRLGELLEETFILDLLPSKAVIGALEDLSTASSTPAPLKRKAKSLLKSYKI